MIRILLIGTAVRTGGTATRRELAPFGNSFSNGQERAVSFFFRCRWFVLWAAEVGVGFVGFVLATRGGGAPHASTSCPGRTAVSLDSARLGPSVQLWWRLMSRV